MTVRAHPELRDLLQFAFTGEEDDRKQILDELRDYNHPDKDTCLIDYSTHELLSIMEDAIERIADRAVKQVDERVELDLVTILSFFYGNFPHLLHTNDALFEVTHSVLESILRRTRNEHTQTQCFVLLRLNFNVLGPLSIDNDVKLMRIRTMLRVFNTPVRPNSIAYIEKLRAHYCGIETCVKLLEAITGLPNTRSGSRLERYCLLIQPLCELLADVFTREPSELQNSHVNDDVQVAKRCFKLAHENLFSLQTADISSEGDAQPIADGVGSVAMTTSPRSYTNSQVFCASNQERVTITKQVFQLIEKLVKGSAASELSRWLRSRMLYLSLCAIWPFALVTLTSSSDVRFNRLLASSALVTFQAFTVLLEHSFNMVRQPTQLQTAGMMGSFLPSHAAHVRTVQSILRVYDLATRLSLIESDIAIEMMHMLLCCLSVESLFTKLGFDPPVSSAAASQLVGNRSGESMDADMKPSVLNTSQYQPANGDDPQSALSISRIKPSDRFLNEVVASLLFHICASNSPNDVVERPRAMCDFFARLTNVVRSAAVSGDLERVPVSNILRFGELVVLVISSRIADYQSELLLLPTAELADRHVANCAVYVQLWTSVACLFFTCFTRPITSNPSETDAAAAPATESDKATTTSWQSFRLGFGLDSCSAEVLARTNRLISRMLDQGLQLCRTVIDNEPMGVKRESLFDQAILGFDAAFDRLCTVYERLYEDNNAVSVADPSHEFVLESGKPQSQSPSKSQLEGSNRNDQTTSTASSSDLLETNNNNNNNKANDIPDGRPACYRLRLQFDLIRVELNNWKSVITKVHSNPYLSNGKWCEMKPRRSRRSRRDGFPKPRPRSKQGACYSGSPLQKPVPAKPVDKYSRCFVRKPEQFGLGHFSKPQLAGLTGTPHVKSPAASHTFTTRRTPAPSASHTLLQGAADPDITDTNVSAVNRFILDMPTSSFVTCLDDSEAVAVANGNRETGGESYDTAFDAFGVDLTDVDEQASVLLQNFIQNFDADPAAFQIDPQVVRSTQNDSTSAAATGETNLEDATGGSKGDELITIDPQQLSMSPSGAEDSRSMALPDKENKSDLVIAETISSDDSSHDGQTESDYEPIDLTMPRSIPNEEVIVIDDEYEVLDA